MSIAKTALPFLLLLISRQPLAAQEGAEVALQRRLGVRSVIASIGHHKGPWNVTGLKKDTIIAGKTVWELNRRGDVYRSTEYYAADTSKVEFQWEKVLYYDRDSVLFHQETYTSISGGTPQPSPRYTPPRQWREGRALVTSFGGEGVTPRFTRAIRTKLEGGHGRNRASFRVTTYTYAPDSALLEKEVSWENAWGQQLAYRYFKAHSRGERPAAPFKPAAYAYEMEYRSRSIFDSRGNLLHEYTRRSGEGPHEQHFRYRYKGGILVATDEYDLAHGPYLRERYKRYPNGLLREVLVYEGYKPHLRTRSEFRYQFFDRPESNGKSPRR